MLFTRSFCDLVRPNMRPRANEESHRFIKKPRWGCTAFRICQLQDNVLRGLDPLALPWLGETLYKHDMLSKHSTESLIRQVVNQVWPQKIY